MNVILVMVISINGKSTKGTEDPRFWASNEDQKHFRLAISKHNLIVMGKKTYLSAKSIMKLEPGKRRIVLARNPQHFKNEAVEGQLEFTNEHPELLVQRLQQLGYVSLLLVGGSTTNSLFFKHKLVDELWLTLEPKIFGEGKGLVDGGVDISLKLLSIKKLNKQGTVLLKYHVHYENN